MRRLVLRRKEPQLLGPEAALVPQMQGRKLVPMAPAEAWEAPQQLRRPRAQQQQPQRALRPPWDPLEEALRAWGLAQHSIVEEVLRAIVAANIAGEQDLPTAWLRSLALGLAQLPIAQAESSQVHPIAVQVALLQAVAPRRLPIAWVGSSRVRPIAVLAVLRP